MNDLRELDITELDSVSGAGIVGWAQAVVQTSIDAAKSAPYQMTVSGGSGSGSGSGDGLGGGMGSGSGSPTCPGCHSPA